MTELSSKLTTLKRPLQAESCCRTLPRKSHSVAPFLPLVRDDCWKVEHVPSISVEVGDKVLFGKYGGTDIEVDEEEVKILRESDILAKVV